MIKTTRVENGLLRGTPAADPRIIAYKGVPFAAPPVGKNRWRAPQPAQDWEGVLECLEFKPISMQAKTVIDVKNVYTREWSVDPDIVMDEDCLYLNIWTPAATPEERLPVFVWYFGGGLQVGHPSEMEFDGERIARRGVILVSINYRVNVFGFLAHPELTAENPLFPTNFGHLDQRAGIEWVKRNIRAFGGDPENITIFGQSAGGGSCQIQVCSPMNKGLFQKAILHSSGGFLPPSSMSPTLEQAERNGIRFFEALGVHTLEEARRADAHTVWEVAMKSRKFAWGTVIGDSFLPDYPVRIIQKNQHNDMDLIIGNTADEFPFVPRVETVEQLESYAREKFGEKAEAFLSIVKNGASDIESMKKNAAYNSFELGNVLWLDQNAATPKANMYYYNFNPEIPGWDHPGSFHSSDLWFAFETLSKCWRPFVGKHYDLARQMCNYWTNFAKTGDPNGPDADGSPMPEWKPYTADCRGPMYFGDVAQMADSNANLMFNFLREGYAKGELGDDQLNGFAARRPPRT